MYVQVLDTITKASGPRIKIGEICRFKSPWDNCTLLVEVVGFLKYATLITSLDQLTGGVYPLRRK